MSILPTTEADTNKDVVFINSYREHRDPVRACVEAQLSDPHYTITVFAKRQLERPEIKAAIEALDKADEKHGPRAEITREAVEAKLMSLAEKAEAEGQYNSAIAALKLLAALRNWLSTNIAITHRHVAGDLSDDELERIASQKRDAVDASYEEVPSVGIGGYNALPKP